MILWSASWWKYTEKEMPIEEEAFRCEAQKPTGQAPTQFTPLTGAPPGSPEGGAAFGFQSGSVNVHLTAVVLDVEPTRPFQAV